MEDGTAACPSTRGGTTPSGARVLRLALCYGAWHLLWDSRQQAQAQARERAETQVVAIVSASDSSYLQANFVVHDVAAS